MAAGDRDRPPAQAQLACDERMHSGAGIIRKPHIRVRCSSPSCGCPARSTSSGKPVPARGRRCARLVDFVTRSPPEQRISPPPPRFSSRPRIWVIMVTPRILRGPWRRALSVVRWMRLAPRCRMFDAKLTVAAVGSTKKAVPPRPRGIVAMRSPALRWRYSDEPSALRWTASLRFQQPLYDLAKLSFSFIQKLSSPCEWAPRKPGNPVPRKEPSPDLFR